MLIMNVTHKTNVHNLLFFIIIKVTAMNASFYTVFFFQMSKNEEDFIQSL